MLYYNLRFFNYIFAIFGLKKPFNKKPEKVTKVTVLDRLWTFIILVSILICYAFVVWTPAAPDIKNNLELICVTNEYIVSLLALITYLFQKQAGYKTLYRTIDGLIKRFNVKAHDLRKFCRTLYLLSIIPFGTCIAVSIWAIFSGIPSHNILVRIPLFLENLHLLLHICIILALLKTLNAKVATELNLSINALFNVKSETEKSVLLAFVFEPNDGEYFGTKYFCHIYGDLCNSIKLLENQHGVQILLESWMIFVSAVIQFTLIALQKMEDPFWNVLRLYTPLLWYTILGFLDDQVRQEVELTEILILKHLIDFRCDQTSRYLLTTFKQLVSTNRLRFRACGLFHVNYAMVLGTVVSVVTYSIIMIQLFMDK